MVLAFPVPWDQGRICCIQQSLSLRRTARRRQLYLERSPLSILELPPWTRRRRRRGCMTRMHPWKPKISGQQPVWSSSRRAYSAGPPEDSFSRLSSLWCVRPCSAGHPEFSVAILFLDKTGGCEGRRSQDQMSEGGFEPP